MQREEVWFYSGGTKVSAWFFPGSGAGRRPGIVFCPGFTGTKYAAFYTPYIEAMTKAGYAVLILDYRGWGDSEGQRGLLYPLMQVEDIRSGLTYLELRDEVDPQRLGLIGVSFGGANVSYVAGVDPRVRCTVSVSGIADGAAWLQRMRREYEWVEFLDRVAEDRRARARGDASPLVDPTEEIMIPTPERRQTTVKGNVPAGKTATATPFACAEAILDYRPADVVHRIAPRAILWTCVERDAVVPPEHSEMMYARAGEPKRLVRLRGATHYAAYLGLFDAICGEALAWYAAHL